VREISAIPRQLDLLARPGGLLPVLLAGLLGAAPGLLEAADTQAGDNGQAGSTSQDNGPLTLDQMRAFSDAIHMIRTYYVDEVSDQALLDAALRGMVAELDPYSEVLDAQQLETQKSSIKGGRTGPGLETEIRNRRLYVKSVVAGGPASRAGVRSGDLLLNGDGKSVRGRPLARSIEALSGPPGSTLQLTVRSAGEPARELSVEREFVNVASVNAELLEGRVAYLALNTFNRRSPDELEQALQELRRQAPDGLLGGIILDLRDNRGGTIRAAMEIADGFLDDGLVVHTEGRVPASKLEYRALPGQWAPELPLLVLVNGRSASAAEILAAALRDNGRAELFGQTTYGKGSAQAVLPLRDGKAIKLTTGRYLTPDGKVIEKTGITPDYPVSEQAGSAEDREHDAVLDAALRYLREQPVPAVVSAGQARRAGG
jgi:carboxyl-terminal processing protease